jgi:hypothetical protein
MLTTMHDYRNCSLERNWSRGERKISTTRKDGRSSCLLNKDMYSQKREAGASRRKKHAR